MQQWLRCALICLAKRQPPGAGLQQKGGLHASRPDPRKNGCLLHMQSAKVIRLSWTLLPLPAADQLVHVVVPLNPMTPNCPDVTVRPRRHESRLHGIVHITCGLVLMWVAVVLPSSLLSQYVLLGALGLPGAHSKQLPSILCLLCSILLICLRLSSPLVLLRVVWHCTFLCMHQGSRVPQASAHALAGLPEILFRHVKGFRDWHV